jgi:hypothetical protein
MVSKLLYFYRDALIMVPSRVFLVVAACFIDQLMDEEGMKKSIHRFLSDRDESERRNAHAARAMTSFNFNYMALVSKDQLTTFCLQF